MTFAELLDQHNIPKHTEGHEHCRPGWLQLDCPFCSKGWGHYRMGYNLRYGYVHCWSCGHHTVANTLMELIDAPYREVKRLLKNVEVEDRGPLASEPVRGKLELPPGVGDLLPAHKRYLRNRGFKPGFLEREWEIKGIGIAADWQWRIFIPVTLNGETVSWTTRSITDKARYRSASPEQEKLCHKDLLYGEDYCRHTVLIVEGPTDVWRIGRGAACTFGTGYRRSQLVRLARFPRRVVCYDSEPMAQRQARKLCDLLEVFPGETYNVQLNSKDPGAATDKEIAELRRRFLD